MSVQCIGFTSSSPGQKIHAAAANSDLKRITAELGSKSPALVFEDADLDAAVQYTLFGIQFASGQVCVANSRIYVQDIVADKFIQLIREKFSNVSMGDPLTPTPRMAHISISYSMTVLRDWEGQ